jgi:EAL domain-containing protein (putative c-di-GMP-specific phosphodiesterase class I)
VDDFGTGYSSLRYLQTLPVDFVKIDQSFIAKIQDSPEQADYLRAIGCQYGQGYHFARPQDRASIEASLAQSPDLTEPRTIR